MHQQGLTRLDFEFPVQAASRTHDEGLRDPLAARDKQGRAPLAPHDVIRAVLSLLLLHESLEGICAVLEKLKGG